MCRRSATTCDKPQQRGEESSNCLAGYTTTLSSWSEFISSSSKTCLLKGRQVVSNIPTSLSKVEEIFMNIGKYYLYHKSLVTHCIYNISQSKMHPRKA